jgi:hypothetical protein
MKSRSGLRYSSQIAFSGGSLGRTDRRAPLRKLALPREPREANKINGLRNRLGKNGFIVLQGFSELSPKHRRPTNNIAEKPKGNVTVLTAARDPPMLSCRHAPNTHAAAVAYCRDCVSSGNPDRDRAAHAGAAPYAGDGRENSL